MSDRTAMPTYNFAVAIVQNKEGKLLAVEETNNRGWWLPAGRVEHGETFVDGVLRETLEEAGIKIELKGILRVEHSVKKESSRMRVVFYANPVDEDAPLKSIEDEHSIRAKWVTLDELREWARKRALRGDELLVWGKYLEKGGKYYPLSVLARETDNPQV